MWASNIEANHDGDDNFIACFHVHVYASGLDATAERPVPPPPGERERERETAETRAHPPPALCQMSSAVLCRHKSASAQRLGEQIVAALANQSEASVVLSCVHLHNHNYPA